MTKTTSVSPAPVKGATRKAPKAKSPAKTTAARAGAASSAINLRIDTTTRALIDRAAAVTGQTRTDFMLASARAQAELVLLDKVYFELSNADWTALNAALEMPAPANAALKSAMKAKPAWERE